MHAMATLGALPGFYKGAKLCRMTIRQEVLFL
jgi:hypothetical protein